MRRKRLFTLLISLLPTASLAGDEVDSLAVNFIRTLPYKTGFLSLPQSRHARASWSEFGGLRWADCPDGTANDSCYTILSSSLQTRKRHYLFAWPLTAELPFSPMLVSPAGDTLRLQFTEKPALPNSQFLHSIEKTVDLYSAKLSNYQSLSNKVRNLNLEATAEATLMTASWIGTYFLLRSDKGDTRGLGYLSASVLTVGLFFDIKEYINRSRVRKEVANLRRELESWDEVRTNNIIDSLLQGQPDGLPFGSIEGIK